VLGIPIVIDPENPPTVTPEVVIESLDLYRKVKVPMTQEKKHKIIAEKIEGCQIVDIPVAPNQHAPNAEKVFFTAEASEQMWRAYPRCLAGAYPKVPNYSSSLDLVARAEAKVAVKGKYARAKYWDLLLKETRGTTASDTFALVTAPPTARVNALVALAQTGVFDERP
jgi:hypothetical protein